MKNATAALQAKEKLLQLYSPDNIINVQINNNTLNLNSYSDEQLQIIAKTLMIDNE
jgi:hypothetical protein